MKKIFLLCSMLPFFVSYSQTGSVGIGTTAPDPKAALDITATGKGLLIPRMDSATRAAITNPPDGLMVFQTDHRKGFWYAISNTWLYIPDKVNSGDNMGSHIATQNVTLNNFDLQLRESNDVNHGVGWYGTSSSSKNWLGQSVDGPVLYGFEGGVLGTKGGGNQSILTWKSTGRVGINNAGPQHALDVTGNVQAQQFQYATPQTHSLSIPLDAFNSVNPDAYRSYKRVREVGGSYFSPELWLTGGAAGQEGFVSAPVNLPNGAVITRLEITGVNNDGTSINPQATLSAIEVLSGTLGYATTLGVNATISIESNTYQTAQSASLSYTVNNDLNSYKVVVRLNQNSGATSLTRVRIIYTVARPT